MSTVLDVELQNFDAHIALNTERFKRIEEQFKKTSDQVEHIQDDIKILRDEIQSSKRSIIIATITTLGAVLSSAATVAVAIMVAMPKG
jgi:chromosome segregation ATPase